MLIGYTGDPHLSDVQTNSRSDDSAKTGLEKLDFVIDLFNEKKVDVIILPGDIFSVKLNSNSYRYQLRVLLSKAKCPIKFLIGNHPGDAVYKNPETYFNRDLGILEFDNYCSRLTKYSVIKGISAYEPIPTEQDPEVEFLAVHHFIGNAWDEEELVIYPDLMKEVFPNLKAVLAGHDHAFYPTYTSRSGVKVIRPGSLMRVSSAQQNKRPIYSGIYDTETNEDFLFDVPHHPFDQVFSVELKALDKAAIQDIDSFLDTLSAVQSYQVSPSEVFNQMLDHVSSQYRELIMSDLEVAGFPDVRKVYKEHTNGKRS